MKKFLKKVVLLSLAMCTMTTFAMAQDDRTDEIPGEHLVNVQETNEGEISVLCIGNSILAHGRADSIGWYGDDWGMAASAAEKDYYHILQKLVYDAGYTNVKWSRSGSYDMEVAIDDNETRDYTEVCKKNLYDAVIKSNPDVIIFQFGENGNTIPATVKSYQNALTQYVNYCKSLKPDVEIILSKPFWGGVKVEAVKNVSMETGFTFADLAVIGADKSNQAIGLFEHTGVAAHPGDKGMEEIAKAFFKELEIVLDKKFGNKDALLAKVDGQYIKTDVPAQVINGVKMVPLRAVYDALGVKVEWDDSTWTASGAKGYTVATIKIGENTLYSNGNPITLEAPAVLVDQRTLIPVSAVTETFGTLYKYDEAKNVLLFSSHVSAREKDSTPVVNAVLKAEDFVKGNGYAISTSNVNLSEQERAVTVTDTPDGVKVSHGGYYTDGINWGGVAYKAPHLLDGLSVTVRFDKVPEVADGEDCWISVDFLSKPALFQVGNIEANPGFMSLIRFSADKLELYEGITAFSYKTGFENENGMYRVKAGDVINVSARLVADTFCDYYEITYTNGENKQSYIFESEAFTNVFEGGHAHVVVSASCNNSNKDAFEYTITDISYFR